MGRTDLLLDLVRTHNVIAALALITLLVVGRVFLRNRRVGWLVTLFALIAVVLGYVLKRINS